MMLKRERIMEIVRIILKIVMWFLIIDNRVFLQFYYADSQLFFLQKRKKDDRHIL